MNNLISNFDQVLKMAGDQGVPLKERGILREYLQSKFLVEFYSVKDSRGMSFVGGTSLRLLNGLPRFSEDLDFDNLGLKDEEVESLVERVVERFKFENIKVELKKIIKEDKRYFELRFPEILYELGISGHDKEKLMIKVDCARFWKGQKARVELFSRYGLIEQVVSNELSQIMVQKLVAYVGRRQVQPRDMYDVVWLYAQGVRLDGEFMRANGKERVVEEAMARFEKEGVMEADKRRLRPFLFREGEVGKLELFGKVLKKMKFEMR